MDCDGVTGELDRMNRCDVSIVVGGLVIGPWKAGVKRLITRVILYSLF